MVKRKKPTPQQPQIAPTPRGAHLPDRERLDFPLVAIGASAGGLEALKHFFAAMPQDSGIAFVVIQHLDPEKLSLMAEILSRSTKMAVRQADTDEPIRPDHVYVAPPGKELTIHNGRLTLDKLPKDKLLASHAFDKFLRSMATEQGDRGICIILSGTGTDGSVGLKAIKTAGGMCMVQKPDDATYDGMPSAAINTGLADYVLPAAEMPAELIHYVRHASYTHQGEASPPAEQLKARVKEILDLLGKKRANDFSGYKHGTLIRRIERRMNLLHLRDIESYAERLEEDDEELDALAKDLVIVVTGFFRDPEAFAVLQEKAIAPLCEQAEDGKPIRVWIPGCATGEEAYSIVILFLEELARCHKTGHPLQIFATDVDKAALQQARNGIFPKTVEADLSPERLDLFFEPLDSGYRIKKGVREAITFSEQDLITDTPFSRIDLISCRNLLIYLKAEAQRRVLSLFHFALKPAGFLFLGNAESVGRESDLFSTFDSKYRIYKKVDSVRVPLISFPRSQGAAALAIPVRKELKPGANLKSLGERQILDHFAPCGVIVNHSLEILQFIGQTGAFLQAPAGDPSLNLLAMVPLVMRTPLRGMLNDLTANQEQQQASFILRLLDREDRPFRHIQVNGRRIKDPAFEEELLLVAFSDLPESAPFLPLDSLAGCTTHELVIKQLEEELCHTRENLESTIEQMEVANEELKATNEEAMSINEELETSKEELQSMNEELTTVNSELEDKVAELEKINNDLDNLLASSDVGFLFLDEQFRIQRFTPAIVNLFHIIPADIGRPLTDFGSGLQGLSLFDEATKVLQTLIPSEREGQTADGRWFLQRVLPYRTRDNHIKGVLVTYLDITTVKEKESDAGRQSALLKVLTDTLPVRIAYVDSDLRYRYVNDPFLRWLNLEANEVVGKQVREVLPPAIYQAAVPRIQEVMAGRPVSFKEVFDYEAMGRRHVLISYTPHTDRRGRVLGYFTLIQDMTEHWQADETRAHLAALVESSQDAIISRSPGGAIISWNSGAERMLGYAAHEMIGNTLDPLFPTGLQEGGGDVSRLLRGTEAIHTDHCCLTKEGGPLEVLITQSPIVGPDGRPAAASIIMSDIDSRKEMERETCQLNKELENKVAERTASLQHHMAQLRKLALDLTQTEQRERQRLALVLHNDLQQILVAAGMRLERIANAEETTGKREAIHQVEALLGQAVAATRSLAVDLRPPVLNSGNLVKSLEWLTDWLWKRFDFTLKFSVSEGVNTDAIPDADIVFLFDTARELCFNIVKHAHVKEGRMTLRRDEQDRLYLTIADNGVGLDLEQQELPEPADGGLGLSSIRNRLALIGGELRIDSAVGKGFSADILLPYSLTAAPQPPSAVPGRAGSPAPPANRDAAAWTAGRKIRVMLVDDHAVVRDGLKMILLDESDIDVVGEAGDGEKALKMARKLQPDVIVMDVNMPKMNGLEATKLIKESFPGICVIALSINDDQGTTNAMLEAGAKAYLNKSGAADDVCEVIRACVKRTSEPADDVCEVVRDCTSGKNGGDIKERGED